MRKSTWTWSRIFTTILSLVVTGITIFPLVWMGLAGFKSQEEVLAAPLKFFPTVWHFENYTSILHDPLFQKAMGTTFLGAITFMILSVAVNAAAAYAFSRLEFSFKKFWWVYVMTTYFIPGFAITITSFVVVSKLGMLDKLAVLILPGVASAYSMFFIRQFYLNIPLALEEAALIDGANRFQIFTRIFLPMSLPPFVIIGIGAYLGYWNAFVWPVMTMTNENWFQIGQYIFNFRSGRVAEMHLLMASSFLAALPTVILFLIFQKYIVANLKMSGLK
ncbi:carbohydrate ABC transporter permease [Cohnella silvisoli]|uniref:Carbohydrate ABC transporter permease n=1 Tax=Cohnella silvisoli TaxID=2873699 RepID=A0ABV1KR83_9BACL|nr:carbohydrate ABC transporter permease [Cohnella silvisoli]MCD9021711.1 carbohydrate ABC transporter permease [Cohnella silvisoli]